MPDDPRSGGPYDHPFLTAKGLRLQLQGRKDTPQPITLPVYPEHPNPSSAPRAIDPFQFQDPSSVPITNVLPSRKFPRPETIARKSLKEHFVSRPVATPYRDQLRAVGRLFIQISDDPVRELATGSAWISGPSTIVTSAHNLYDFTTNRWSRAVEFHPGYDYYGERSLPSCRVTSCYLPRDYFQNPATNHDIAICYVDRNIGDIVGSHIRMKTVSGNQLFDQERVSIVGYPAGSEFDFGKQLWQSTGDYLFGRSNGPNDDYAPAMATNFGAGASGCPWLVKDEKSGRLVAVGATSGHAKLRYIRGEPNLMSLTSPVLRVTHVRPAERRPGLSQLRCRQRLTGNLPHPR